VIEVFPEDSAGGRAQHEDDDRTDQAAAEGGGVADEGIRQRRDEQDDPIDRGHRAELALAHSTRSDQRGRVHDAGADHVLADGMPVTSHLMNVLLDSTLVRSRQRSKPGAPPTRKEAARQRANVLRHASFSLVGQAA